MCISRERRNSLDDRQSELTFDSLKPLSNLIFSTRCTLTVAAHVSHQHCWNGLFVCHSQFTLTVTMLNTQRCGKILLNTANQ